LGVNLFAKQRVDGRDRRQLERLCRYVMRPPLSQERLVQLPDGRLRLTLKNTWKDGTRALLLHPHDLLVRLCAAIPPPWFHMIRYFGVLSSDSSERSLVVPESTAPHTRHRFTPPPAAGDQLELEGMVGGVGAVGGQDGAEPQPSRAGRSRWGWLLRHVFRQDVDTCVHCGGAMRWTEVATKSSDITRLLARHGLGPDPPPVAAPATASAVQLRLRL
jgi:hypothetical protein